MNAFLTIALLHFTQFQEITTASNVEAIVFNAISHIASTVKISSIMTMGYVLPIAVMESTKTPQISLAIHAQQGANCANPHPNVPHAPHHHFYWDPSA